MQPSKMNTAILWNKELARLWKWATQDAVCSIATNGFLFLTYECVLPLKKVKYGNMPIDKLLCLKLPINGQPGDLYKCSNKGESHRKFFDIDDEDDHKDVDADLGDEQEDGIKRNTKHILLNQHENPS
ncbi:hypothetical protein L2E82_51678 [Cichorium intybus]|nr:hypothetical protein L2E82_51678 [Cichorium intybus]